MQQIQTREYDRASFLALAILGVLTGGFYITHLMFFPSFEGFQSVHHFHGAIMLLWIAMLIVQPWLMILHFVLWELRYMSIWQKACEISTGIFF